MMVPVEKMETEELLVSRCVFWESLLPACDGAMCPVLCCGSRQGGGEALSPSHCSVTGITRSARPRWT